MFKQKNMWTGLYCINMNKQIDLNAVFQSYLGCFVRYLLQTKQNKTKQRDSQVGSDSSARDQILELNDLSNR